MVTGVQNFDSARYSNKMRRVKLSSKTNNVRVQLKEPLIDIKRDYRVTVERFEIPHLESRTLGTQHLFTVKRKLASAVQFPEEKYDEPDHVFYETDAPQFRERAFAEFVPTQIHTVSGFVQCANDFLRRFARSVASVSADISASLLNTNPSLNFTSKNGIDWADGVWDDEEGLAVNNAVNMVLASDGRVGFRFNEDGAHLFAIQLTEAGKEMMGFTQDYITPVSAGVYTVSSADPRVVSAYTESTITSNKSDITYGDRSLFSSLRYRDEVVIRTSLPLSNQVHVHNDKSNYLQQLASYQLPGTNPVIRYTGYESRQISETHSLVHTFEENIETHNSFKVRGDTFQLFHIDIFIRKHLSDGSLVEVPFPMDPQHYFTLQLVLSPF